MASVISQPYRSTLVDVLSLRAEATPEQPAYIALADSLDVEATLDFATLWLRATAVAASLQRGRFTEERVLIACSKPVDAAIAFWATLCAGAVPVPVPSLNARHVRRLAAVMDD